MTTGTRQDQSAALESLLVNVPHPWNPHHGQIPHHQIQHSGRSEEGARGTSRIMASAGKLNHSLKNPQLASV